MFTCFICVNSCINLYLSLLHYREKRLLNITSNNWRRRALLTCPAGYLLPSPPHFTNRLSAQPELSQHAAAEFTPAPQTSCQALRMVRWIILLLRERVLINIIMREEWGEMKWYWASACPKSSELPCHLLPALTDSVLSKAASYCTLKETSLLNIF